jgi:hypothetical protein
VVELCGKGSIELVYCNLSALCGTQCSHVYGDDISEAGELLFSDLHILVKKNINVALDRNFEVTWTFNHVSTQQIPHGFESGDRPARR